MDKSTTTFDCNQVITEVLDVLHKYNMSNYDLNAVLYGVKQAADVEAMADAIKEVFPAILTRKINR